MYKNIFIISGPSGAGEDTIIKEVKKILPAEVVITTSTRKMRQGESQGKPYYFISRDEFKDKIKNNKFIEWACEYNDNYYGVTQEEFERVAASGKIGLWKIEYKGVIKAKKLFPRIKAIFIIASLEEMENRIRERDNVSESYIKKRMEYTKEWLKYENIYDYKVRNGNGELQKAVEETVNIIQTESATNI